MFGGLAYQNDLLLIAHANGTPRVTVVGAGSLELEFTIPVVPAKGRILACAGIAASPTFVIHIADPIARAIHRVSPFGRPLPSLGEGRAATLPIAPDHRGELAEPSGVAVDNRGAIYTVSAGGTRVYAVQKYASNGRFTGSFRAFGVPGEAFASARGICCHGDLIFVADTGNGCVHAYKTNGAFLQVFSTAIMHGERSAPVFLTSDAERNLWILERGDRHELRMFTFGGEYKKTVLAGEIEAPVSVAVTRDGVIFILDEDGDRLRAFSRGGELLRDFIQFLDHDVFIGNPPNVTYRRGP
ncbi:MAG: NHL repeat-containing protein [Planctomycetes bacterium]|nr:NHL repeat-containing protein [Planctomycetota bacterium]